MVEITFSLFKFKATLRKKKQFMFHFQNSLANQNFIMCDLKVIKNAEANS